MISLVKKCFVLRFELSKVFFKFVVLQSPLGQRKFWNGGKKKTFLGCRNFQTFLSQKKVATFKKLAIVCCCRFDIIQKRKKVLSRVSFPTTKQAFIIQQKDKSHIRIVSYYFKVFSLAVIIGSSNFCLLLPFSKKKNEKIPEKKLLR